jgi:arginyl-tRNA synthetase
MSVKSEVQGRLEQALEACEAEGLWPRELRTPPTLERPKQAEHGDLATNVAMTLARAAKKNPRAIAEAIVRHLGASASDPVLASAELAGPGFINLRVARDLHFRELSRAFAQGARFGRSDALAGQRVIVEYVSANPTGPMHVGHGRGAITGDVIARLLDVAGATVHREYYINDAGGQVGHLAHATWVRAQELFAAANPGALAPERLGPDDYQGEYVVDIARALLAAAPDAQALVTSPFAPQKDRLQRFAVDFVMREMIQKDLARVGIQFDQYFSERAMHEDGRVHRAISQLEAQGVASMRVLPPPKGLERDPDAPGADEPLLVMETSRYGDDVDRPLRKADGALTYFAGDVAYHWDKLQRGFTRVINVWGADHGGYVPRVRAAIQALGYDPKAFEVVLVQMVNLVRDGVPVKMGKRSGNFVTLADVVEEAGPDAMRVFFIMRTSNSMFDFDLALAKKQSDDNPVFYVQYGHARAASILRKAAEKGVVIPEVSVESLRGLVLPEELDLLQRILSLPEVLAGAAASLEPHRVVFYLQETIAALHSYLTRYKNTEKVLSDDPVRTRARLALMQVLKLALGNALNFLGVSAPDEMRRELADEPGTPPA